MAVRVSAFTRVVAITSSIISLTIYSIFLVDLEEGSIDRQTVSSLSLLLFSGFYRLTTSFNGFEVHLIIDAIFSIFVFIPLSAEEGVRLAWA